MRRCPASPDQRPGTRAKQQWAHLHRSLKRRACSSVGPSSQHLHPVMCSLHARCASLAVTSRPQYNGLTCCMMTDTVTGILHWSRVSS